LKDMCRLIRDAIEEEGKASRDYLRQSREFDISDEDRMIINAMSKDEFSHHEKLKLIFEKYCA